MLQNKIHHPLANDPVMRRFPRHVNAIEPPIQGIEGPKTTAVRPALPGSLLIDRKHHIRPGRRLLQHGRQQDHIISPWINDRHEIPQRIFQTRPRGGVRIDFLGQGVDLQVGKALLAGKLLEHRHAVIFGGIVHDDQLIIADQGRDEGRCLPNNGFQFARLVTDDQHQR